MVCDRCISAVRQQLESQHYTINKITLGKVEIAQDIYEPRLTDLRLGLAALGFELINNEKEQLVESIKNVIITKIHHSDLSELQISYSQLISKNLDKEYAYLSRVFSEAEQTTIEQYIIQQRIEKVKELLEYEEDNLNEIAWKMGYSSSAHLSAQFKKVTGLSPLKYKKTRSGERKPLDNI